jgi:gluconate 2-dehydrogenase gamma chain
MNDEGQGHGDVPDAENGSGGRRFSRRRLLQVGAVGVAGATAGGLLTDDAAAQGEAAPPPLRFLTRWEFDLVTEMAETIWPTDDLGPGARVAGVGYYIDGQLAGGWGMGQRFYMQGPFLQPADSGHGWQIPLVPRDVYRACLPAFDRYVQTRYGAHYVDLDAKTQAQALDDLRTGKVSIPLSGATTFAGTDFYGLFRQNVLEGMLSDPSYGGNRNMVGWKWVGFPGNPMRRGGDYAKWIFNEKPYPYQYKPLGGLKPHKGGM